ncbi:MAG: hypothetical protein QOH31_1967 [Verrucomicrobiota bacterium]|jgi:hypothetical protein
MGNTFKVKWTTEGGETGVKDLEPNSVSHSRQRAYLPGLSSVLAVGYRFFALASVS